MRHSLDPKSNTCSSFRSTVLATGIIGCLTFLALAIAMAMGKNQLEQVDEAIFDWFRGGASFGPPWFSEAVRDVSSLGSLSILIGASLISAAYLALLGRWWAALLVFSAAAGGIALGMGLKIPFDRARPDPMLHETRVFTRSFPSAHATTSAAILLTLGGLVARARAVVAEQMFIICTVAIIILLIGVSRIYLGVHWPSDVVAGWALGSAWACGCWLALSPRQLQPNHPA